MKGEDAYHFTGYVSFHPSVYKFISHQIKDITYKGVHIILQKKREKIWREKRN